MRKILLGIIAILFATPSFAVDSDPCRNLFNKNAQNTNNGFVTGYYLHNETGALAQFGSTRISEYIKVDSNTDYYLTSRTAVATGSAGVCWYDNNKTQISCTSANTGRKTSPDTAKYIRISYWAAEEDIVQFERGTTATEYVPYNPNCIEFEYTSATGTVSQNGTPTPDNPIEPVFYQQGNMILRAVGDVADSYDATTGKITRRIGVKVFNGTEALTTFNSDSYIKSDASDVAFVLPTSSESNNNGGISNRLQFTRNGASIWYTIGYPNYWTLNNRNQLHMNFANEVLGITDYTQETQSSVIAKAKAYLKSQYDAGTPYVFYYTLNTPVQEDWTETSYRSLSIKIATTKYNETAFSPLNTALANAISVVDSVVSNTITQAGKIATLQAQKQTRPDETCPAGKKCLLVEDASGIPHWYEIVERYSRLPDGYTELAYLTSGTDGQYIDTGILFDPTKNFRVVGNFINPDATLRKIILGNYYSQQIETYYSIELYTDGKFRNYMSADAGSAFNIYSPTAVPADTMAYFDTSYNALAHQTTTTLRYGTTEQTYSGATPETTTVAVHTLKLFNDKRNSSPVYNNPVSIGAVQIYIDDILAHHYVPARRESDGVLGMYDLADPNPATAFYTNAGTGEFTAGDPVSE